MDNRMMNLVIPLPRDPADDPPHEVLMQEAKHAADEMAATRDLHAVNLRLIEINEDTHDWNDDGDWVWVGYDENGLPKGRRFAYFKAEAIAI